MSEPKAFNSLIEAISCRKEQNPDERAFVFLDASSHVQEITNEQFYIDMQRYARGLIAKGIQPGEIVLLALDHGYELLCCFWGAICCGAVPSIMTYWRPGSDADIYAKKIKKLAHAVRTRAIISQPDLLSAMSAALEKTNCPVFSSREIAADASGSSADLPKLEAEQIALMQFTSGTTSEPKAIQFSHRAILDHVKANATHNGITKDSVYVSWLPFYHDMGLINHVRHLVHGGPLVLMSPQTWLEQPVMLLKAVHSYKGTAASMPNFGFDYCVRRIRDEELSGIDLSSWRFLSNGSEPVALSSIHRFCERFGPYGFHPEALKVSYGMAENVAGVSTTPTGQSIQVDWVSIDGLQMQNRAIPVEKYSPGAKAVVSCGYPYPGIDLAIVDDQWTKLAEREVGEIVISASTLFTGYYLAPEETKGLFRERWFRTGDIGYIADGQLYVCGRKKDLIIVGGRNIQPQAIENIAADVFGPCAGRCAAFGVSNSTLGTELPVLVVEQRKQLEDAEKENLIHQVRKRVSDELDAAISYVRLVPKGWVVRTTSGKIARDANRKKYISEGFNVPNDEESGVSANDLTPQQMKEKVTHLFEKVLGIKGIGPDDDFVELGGDSLSALRLLLEIEQRFAQEISAADFFFQPTVEHVAAVLQKQISEYPAGAQQTPAGFVAQQQLLSETKPQSNYLPDKRMNRIDWIKQKTIAIEYRIKIALLIWLYGQKWTQQIFSPERTRIIRQFYALIENPLQNENKTVQCSLILNHSGKIKKQLLERIFSNKQGCWPLQIDITNLKHAYGEGKGVIIVGRHVPSISGAIIELAVEWLSPNAYKLVRRAQYFLPETAQSLQKNQKQRLKLSIYLDQLFQSKKLLKQGNIVSILPDAQGGVSRGIQIPFHRRMRDFKTGFAELAIETGAAVIPVSVVVDVSSKKVNISFLEPFNAGSADMSRSERVEFLVRQYVSFLRDEWARCPGSVPLPQIRRHLWSYC